MKNRKHYRSIQMSEYILSRMKKQQNQQQRKRVHLAKFTYPLNFPEQFDEKMQAEHDKQQYQSFRNNLYHTQQQHYKAF